MYLLILFAFEVGHICIIYIILRNRNIIDVPIVVLSGFPSISK